MKDPRGGPNRSQGRKPLPPAKRKTSRQINLDDAEYDVLLFMGNGNASVGTRKLIEDAQRAECSYTPSTEVAFDTACGNAYYLYTEWSLAQEIEYGVKYCPFCGGMIREVK